MHKKCSGLKRTLTTAVQRAREMDAPWTADTEGSASLTWQAGGGSFFLLPTGDMLSAACGFERSTTTRVKTALEKFKELLPFLLSCNLSFKTCGCVYSSYVRSAMLHASQTWPLTKPNLQRLQRNDRAIIRQICNVKQQDTVTTKSNALLAPHWRSGPQVEGKRGPRRLKITWKQLTERDYESGSSQLQPSL